MLRTPHDRIVPGDGLGPLQRITSWPLLRYLDSQIAFCREEGTVTVKIRKGRVAGAPASAIQDPLWRGGEAA